MKHVDESQCGQDDNDGDCGHRPHARAHRADQGLESIDLRGIRLQYKKEPSCGLVNRR